MLITIATPQKEYHKIRLHIYSYQVFSYICNATARNAVIPILELFQNVKSGTDINQNNPEG